MKKRKLTLTELEAFEFLNDLRESGEVNMYGAGLYIEDRFGHDKIESRRLLKLWMENFKPDGEYETTRILF